jgi:hypothetical protein
VNWEALSENLNAIPILEKNLDKVDWDALSYNPNVIHLLAELDTNLMLEQCKSFAKELTEYVFHPTRLERISQQYQVDLCDYLDLL